MKTSGLLVLPVTITLLLGLSCTPIEPTATLAPTAPEVTPTPATPQVTPTPPTPQLSATPVTTGPVITKIRYQDVQQEEATLFWWTNVPTTGRVEYGHSQQYGMSTPWSEGLTTVNGYTLTGLEISTSYYMRLRVKDAAGNETVSPERVIPYQEMMDTEYRF